MKFFNITDTAAFFQKILDCKGNVYYCDSNGRIQDLKQAAQQLNAFGWFSRLEKLDEIDVIVEQSSDSSLLMRYMMEASCAR